MPDDLDRLMKEFDLSEQDRQQAGAAEPEPPASPSRGGPRRWGEESEDALVLEEAKPAKPTKEAKGKAEGDPDLSRRLGALERENELLREQMTRSGERGEGTLARDLAAALEYNRQRQAEEARRAEAGKAPTLENPEDLHTDAAALADFISKRSDYAAGRTRDEIMGGVEQMFRQAFGHLEGEMAPLREQAERASRDEARKSYEAHGFEDFDELYGEVANRLRSNNYGHLLRDPEQVHRALITLRLERKLPLSAPERSSRVDSLPVSPSARRGGGPTEGRMRELQPMAREIARNLGLPKLEVTEQELRDHRLL